MGGAAAVIAGILLWTHSRGDLTTKPVVDAQIIDGADGRELWIFRKSGSGVTIERVEIGKVEEGRVGPR